METTQSSSIGRAPGPLSPPTIAQLMPDRSNRTEIFEQWLDREESNARGSCLQMLDSWQAVFAVFDADAPPDVFLLGGEAQPAAEQVAQSLRPLGQNLKRVPVGR